MNPAHTNLQTTIQTAGFQTSLDLAREQSYSTSAAVGSKRPRSEDDVFSGFTTASQVFRAENERNEVRARSNAIPSSNKRRIIASQIRFVSGKSVESCDFISEYSQRKAISSTPGPSQDPLLSLRHPRYGLPSTLVDNFAKLGVNAIYPWQATCLLGAGHLTGEKNLVYSAPTGGGKSLVAEVIMLKRVIESPTKKALLVLPYVALVQEKMQWLRRLVDGVTREVDGPNFTQGTLFASQKAQGSLRVTGFFGGSKSRMTWADTDIAVCTIEKANILVNSAIEECKIDDLGVVVIDELHMLDDEHRGYLIEITVTKLLLLQQNIQIIGMSATLSNTELLAKWLHANYYISRYRPIPIEEYVVYENSIYPAENSAHFLRASSSVQKFKPLQENITPHRVIAKSMFRELDNPMSNAMVALALETANSGYGALVFCGSRQLCQSNAVLISKAMPDTSMVDDTVLERRLDLIASLRTLPCGLDPVLEQTIIKGVAFHHAGLTAEERELIADAYDKGILKVLIATCSLAAGINLPARRVILCGARMGRELIGPAMLRQMRGRAGRKGKDEVGETYLCCQKEDLLAVAELLEAELPAITSGLSPKRRGITRALLEAIAVRLVSGRDAVYEYVKCTLLYHSIDQDELFSMVEASLQELQDSKLIELTNDESFVPTRLGQAIVASGFTPEDGLFIHDELKRALQALVLDGEMHMFYLFAPLQTGATSDVDWGTFRDELYKLDESGIRAMQFVGVKPGHINNLAQGGPHPRDPTLATIYRRAYTAFQLRDLCNEVPITVIANKYHIPRGSVQTLAQTCHGFAAGMVKFCQRMGWDVLAVVLDHMRDRLQAGARADLLEMAQVAYVKSRTARLLWENGFKTLRALAEADPKDLVPVLMMAHPRNGKQDNPREAARFKRKLLAKAEIIVGSANKLWQREMIVDLEE
ncbi:hypothetical protein VTO42DRAFT_374 [Malbranchea cinnamomea]